MPSYLTPRQLEIVAYSVRGFTNAEIAHYLGVSLMTVKNHKSEIHIRLGLDSKYVAGYPRHLLPAFVSLTGLELPQLSFDYDSDYDRSLNALPLNEQVDFSNAYRIDYHPELRNMFTDEQSHLLLNMCCLFNPNYIKNKSTAKNQLQDIKFRIADLVNDGATYFGNGHIDLSGLIYAIFDAGMVIPSSSGLPLNPLLLP